MAVWCRSCGDGYTFRYQIAGPVVSSASHVNRRFSLRGLLLAVVVFCCVMGVLRYGFNIGSIPLVLIGGLSACLCMNWCLGWLINGIHGGAQWILATVVLIVLALVVLSEELSIVVF